MHVRPYVAQELCVVEAMKMQNVLVASRGGEALGWTYSADVPVMGGKPQRIWKVRLAGLELLRIGSCTGALLAVCRSCLVPLP